MEHTATRGSACTPAEEGRVTLTFPSGAALGVQVSALRNASRVLKEALTQPLTTPGVLALDDDAEGAACWAAVVQIAELSAYPLQLITWDNLECLMRLADKYNMPYISAACAEFLSRNKESLTLEAPLTSPKNVLLAATLIERQCCWDGAPPELCSVEAALESALSPLLQKRTVGCVGSETALAVATKLRALIQDKRYTTTISSTVQLRAPIQLAPT
ncbi:hypothetical protein GPECTOR_333g62 [Gonium pectorale]|uniref:BTB domain-containing protein n=1 Tax=Gonium pectorale TaxID=33097 RepID=A0A150FVL6_GONPE|nr:hypothetical protein GPECTOR_333g62 [Gonium pectorale]|eukprot:KXZ41663.1 hypothetical protein GPECTOR_333g62 [Gonium pectorale]